jgi:mRNA-degrading endonuclease RelE of RelBE toxin-antitoxin system
VSEDAAPQRLAVIWSPEARADLRAIDRETAMQILHCVDRYLATRTGDVKKLKPPLAGFRLRCGDYRVFFDPKDENAIGITSVRNRREAYR